MNKRELNVNYNNVVKFTYGDRGDYLGVLRSIQDNNSYVEVTAVLKYPNISVVETLPLEFGEIVIVMNKNIFAVDGQFLLQVGNTINQVDKASMAYMDSLNQAYGNLFSSVEAGFLYYRLNQNSEKNKNMYLKFRKQMEVLLMHRKIIYRC